MNIGDRVIAKIFDREHSAVIEDVYKSELGKPSIYKLEGFTALFYEHEIKPITDDDAS